MFKKSWKLLILFLLLLLAVAFSGYFIYGKFFGDKKNIMSVAEEDKYKGFDDESEVGSKLKETFDEGDSSIGLSKVSFINKFTFYGRVVSIDYENRKVSIEVNSEKQEKDVFEVTIKDDAYYSQVNSDETGIDLLDKQDLSVVEKDMVISVAGDVTMGELVANVVIIN